MLSVTLVMIVYLAICAKQLRQTHLRRITFDFAILIIVIIMLASMLLYEFVIIQQVTLLTIEILQSQVRAIIGANFIQKGLVLLNKQEEQKMRYIAYYLIISGLNVATIVLAFGVTGLNCNDILFSFHWYLVLLIDIAQSIWIYLAANQLIKQIKEQVGSHLKKIGESLGEDRQYSCLIAQMKAMSIGCLIFCFVSAVFMTVANILNKQYDSMIVCRLDWYLIPVTDGGSVLLALHALYFYAFATLTWHVFYLIPFRHGLILARNVRDVSKFQSNKFSKVNMSINNMLGELEALKGQDRPTQGKWDLDQSSDDSSLISYRYDGTDDTSDSKSTNPNLPQFGGASQASVIAEKDESISSKSEQTGDLSQNNSKKPRGGIILAGRKASRGNLFSNAKRQVQVLDLHRSFRPAKGSGAERSHFVNPT